MTTKILGTQITAGTIETTQLSNTATATLVKTLAPKVLYANVASNTFTVLDDTAVNVGGGYIVVTGAQNQRHLIIFMWLILMVVWALKLTE